MNANVMIGAGIFVGPHLMAQKAGFASFLGWPIVALIFLPVVLSVATMARLFPGSGGFYSYAKNLINPTAGFFSGWAFYLAYTGVAALLTIVLRDNVILPMWNINPILFNFGFLVILVLLSMVNMQTVGRIQNTGVLFKFLPLILVISIFAFYWNPSFSISTTNLFSVPLTVPIALFGYWGFEICCSISHLIKGDKANASRAVLIAFFMTMVIYTMFHFGLLHIMGAAGLATNNIKDFILFLGTGSSFTKFLGSVVTFSLAFAFANSIFSILTATAATLHSLAEEKVLPFSEHLVKENAAHRPWVAILVQAALTFIIISTTSNQFVLISLVNLGILIAFLLTMIALCKHQLEHKKYGGLMVTCAGFVSWTIFTYYSWFSMGDTVAMRLIGTGTLVAAIALGMVMYTYEKRRRAY